MISRLLRCARNDGAVYAGAHGGTAHACAHEATAHAGAYEATAHAGAHKATAHVPVMARALRARGHLLASLRQGLHRVLTILSVMVLAACASEPKPSDYAQEKPVLDLKAYLQGPLTAHGVFTDRSGKVVKRFTVAMTGSWNGDEGVLDERFTYSDGTQQTRVWKLKSLGDGIYEGTADDVVGRALGQARGNALNWRYTLKLPVDGTVYEVQFDDWMFLMDERVMLNKARMSKFGIFLGEVTLAFYR